MPQIPAIDVNEAVHQYLFVAIDRASRWVDIDILPEKTAANVRDVLHRLVKNAPFTIQTILTDHGKVFTDRFCATGERKPTERHRFDCHGIEQTPAHRHPPPSDPWHGRALQGTPCRGALATIRFDSAQNLADTLTGDVQ